jgi:hypothetical protein
LTLRHAGPTSSARDVAQSLLQSAAKTQNKNGSSHFFPYIEQKPKAAPLAGNDING